MFSTPPPRRGPTPGPAPEAPLTARFCPSDEQVAVLDAGAAGHPVIVVNAFAGTGKTTVAQMFAEANTTERFLYLCLGRANAEEARRRFGSNVTPKTTHALALASMARQIGGGSRIEGRDRPWRPKSIMEELRIGSYRQAAMTQKILAKFFGSEDGEIGEEHATEANKEFNLTARDIAQCVIHANGAWRKMNDAGESTTIPHDAYLKMFSSQSPNLPYDWIIYDEAQDANPVTASIIKAQAKTGKTKVLCIGDRHQSIFGFRGSIDAMTEFGQMPHAKQLNLTKTWRFGPGVAADATTLLHELKGETASIAGMGQDGPWKKNQHTILSRTNACLFHEAADRNGKGIHWVGGVENYRVSLLEDAYRLFSRDKSNITDHFLKTFHSWDQFVMYGENSRDPEATSLVKLIETHQSRTPVIVQNILRECVPNPEDASIIMTTAHKSKGLDWNCVRLADDFKVLEDAENALLDDPGKPLPEKITQEVNLLYVAMTRAKKAVSLDTATRAWFGKLGEHQDARRNAMESQALTPQSARGG